jgi:prolyl-tRNA synthetase
MADNENTPKTTEQVEQTEQDTTSKSAIKKAEKQAKMAAAKAEKAAKQTVAVVGGKKEKEKELIGIVAQKTVDFSSWYLEVVSKAGMIEYYNEVGGGARDSQVHQSPTGTRKLTP